MKAIGYQQSLPADDPRSLQDIELPEPTPGPRDLLVEVRAISVNPVDTKIRTRMQPDEGQYQVLGWDVAGVVRAVGPRSACSSPATRCTTPVRWTALVPTASGIWSTSASWAASRRRWTSPPLPRCH